MTETQAQDIEEGRKNGSQPIAKFSGYGATPFGLLCFGMTTLMLSFAITEWSEVKFEQTVLCYAFFFGGMGQFVAGLIEVLRNNIFGGTVLMSYGCFWLGQGLVIILTLSGLFKATPIGTTLYNVLWAILTLGFCIISFKKRAWAIRAVLILLFIAFSLLAGGVWSKPCNQAGGYVAFFCALFAVYAGLGDLAKDETGFTLPLLL